MDPTGLLTPHSPAPHPVCLTPAASDGGVASSLEESPVPLAQKPKEPAVVDCSPSSTGTVATVKACSQSSADSGYTPVEHPSSLATVRACSQSSAESATTPVEHPSSVEQSPRIKKRPGVPPPSNGAAVKRGKKEQGTKTAPIDPDAMASDDVDKKPSKAEVGRVLPNGEVLEASHSSGPIRCRGMFLLCRGPKPACYQQQHPVGRRIAAGKGHRRVSRHVWAFNSRVYTICEPGS